MASKKTSAKKTSAIKDLSNEKKVTHETGSSPGVLRYALASARTTLGDGDEDTVVEEAGDVVNFACRGVPYATLRVEGNELVVTFLKPKNVSELESKLKYYKAAQKSGWLEWRRVVSRDPRPGLEAGFGKMIGQTMYEILHGERAT